MKTYKTLLREKTRKWNIEYSKLLEELILNQIKDYSPEKFLLNIFSYTKTLKGKDKEVYIFNVKQHIILWPNEDRFLEKTLIEKKKLLQNILSEILFNFKQDPNFNIEEFIKKVFQKTSTKARMVA